MKMMGIHGVRSAALIAMQQVAAEHGLEVQITNEKIEGAKAGFWFSFELEDDTAKEDARRRQFERNCCCRATGYSVQPDDYGMTLTCKGLRYRLIGVNKNADKYPLETEALDGGPNYRLPMQAFRIAKGNATQMDKVLWDA